MDGSFVALSLLGALAANRAVPVNRWGVRGSQQFGVSPRGGEPWYGMHMENEEIVAGPSRS